ncbi:MAG TPA: T9SS type A sorting domain-containing protein [Bacteroidales bacterium]|nr:T9SS type A sorting domain-containing protein [Bacteroidales bacterium]
MFPRNQLAESNFDYNFLIRAIVCDKITDVPVNSAEGNAISFYPNPVEDDGYIKFVNNQNSINANIEVVNMLGQVIISQSISNFTAGENVMPVNLSGLSKGIYVIKISTINPANLQVISTKTIKLNKK